MKKLLLVSGLFFSGGMFANMDNICVVYSNENLYSDIEKCERNNILLLKGIRNIKTEYESLPIINYIAYFCRHDRQVNYELNKQTDTFELVCVLYSNEPRKLRGVYE